MTKLIEEHMSETLQKQKIWYDRSAWMRELKSNDQVLVLLPKTHNKLLAKWQGSYNIIRRMEKVTSEVDMSGSRRRRKVYHTNLLKK